MKQLAAARAVVTIWSPNSIKSDWVRAEAGRAKAEGKLIPVKTSELTYADIPLPFGEMHTENLASTDLIRAAIVAQLSKPASPQAPFWQITRTFKYQVLTWIGIVGTAITVFANLHGVLDLADSVRELVSHWHEWNQTFWGWVFSLAKVKVPKVLAPLISFTVFVAMLVAGVNLSVRSERAAVKPQHEMPLVRKVGIFVGGLVLYFVMVPLWIGGIGALEEKLGPLEWAWTVSWMIPIVLPMAYLGYFVKERAWSLVASVLFLFMGGCLILAPLWQQAGTTSATESMLVFFLGGVVLFPICWMAVILFSPLQQLTRRLLFVVLGVLTLVGLSEVSKLDLRQYLIPATMSENSAREPVSSPAKLIEVSRYTSE